MNFFNRVNVISRRPAGDYVPGQYEVGPAHLGKPGTAEMS